MSLVIDPGDHFVSKRIQYGVHQEEPRGPKAIAGKLLFDFRTQQIYLDIE